jgi:hypothetical protein
MSSDCELLQPSSVVSTRVQGQTGFAKQEWSWTSGRYTECLVLVGEDKVLGRDVVGRQGLS